MQTVPYERWDFPISPSGNLEVGSEKWEAGRESGINDKLRRNPPNAM